MTLRFDDISINTLIGNGSFVRGDLKVNGFIRIDGDIAGNLETDGAVIISEKARILGNVTAKSIIVGGIIIGDITAKEGIKLLSSSAVIGNIMSRRVQMEDKVIFHGHCISIENEENYEKSSESFLQAKAIREKAVL